MPPREAASVQHLLLRLCWRLLLTSQSHRIQKPLSRTLNYLKCGFQDKSGLTALHWAASRGREACVAALLAKGADPTCLSHTFDSNLGCTAADMASSAGHTGIAAVLAEASLVHALSKAQTGRLPASTVSLLGETSSESEALLMAVTESHIQPQMP